MGGVGDGEEQTVQIIPIYREQKGHGNGWIKSNMNLGKERKLLPLA